MSILYKKYLVLAASNIRYNTSKKILLKPKESQLTEQNLNKNQGPLMGPLHGESIVEVSRYEFLEILVIEA